MSATNKRRFRFAHTVNTSLTVIFWPVFLCTLCNTDSSDGPQIPLCQPEDAGIEPRTVATALEARRSDHYAVAR
jgi:hypothetical protein